MQELSCHILDLVQNSLEAGATRVKLEIVESCKQDRLIIKVQDNGRGMTKEEVQNVIDPFCTSRRTRKVGLGLALLDMSTRQCGGYLKIESEIGKGTAVEAGYSYNHWDRPPLGDIKSTLLVLIVTNPKLDFTYQHTVENRFFALDSGIIKQMVGNTNLTHPEVLTWLKQYIEQKINDLYGG